MVQYTELEIESPASLIISGLQPPSPVMYLAVMPSCLICLTIGPACASIPPNMITSGLAWP